MKAPKIVKLKNGLTVLSYPSKDFLTSSVLVLVKNGTDYETKAINGISHFLEHLFFKGTRNYSAKELSLELDKIGAEYNAFTSYEYTGYYIKTLPHYFERGVYLIAELLCHPLFPPEEIEKERRVILEEINYNYDNPISYIFDEGIKIAYGDQPAGWPILGTKDTLKNIDRQKILKYFQDHYNPKNTFIILTGNFHEKKIINLVEKLFKNYGTSKKPSSKKQFKNFPKALKGKTIRRKDLKQAHILILFKTLGLNELKERRLSLGLLTSVLGYGFSSRLFRILREKLGVTYYLRVNIDFYTNRSYFYLQTGSSLDKIDLTLKEISQALKEIKTQKVEKEELEKAKAVLESNILLNYESSLSIGYFWGINYLLTNTLLAPQEVINKIKKITSENILKEANFLFNLSQLNYVILLPSDLSLDLKFTKILYNNFK